MRSLYTVGYLFSVTDALLTLLDTRTSDALTTDCIGNEIKQNTTVTLLDEGKKSTDDTGQKLKKTKDKLTLTCKITSGYSFDSEYMKTHTFELRKKE